MDNAAIAKIFESITNLLEVKGDSPFKIRAYQRAARTIEHLPVPVGQLRRMDFGSRFSLDSRVVCLSILRSGGFYSDVDRLSNTAPDCRAQVAKGEFLGPILC